MEVLRDNQHFIFSIESTGAMPARTIMIEGIRLLRQKAMTLLHAAGGGDAPSGSMDDIPIMPPGKAALHGQAAMRNPDEEDA